MALIDCPECGKQVSSNATACPNCGEPIAEAAKQDPRAADAPALRDGGPVLGDDSWRSFPAAGELDEKQHQPQPTPASSATETRATESRKARLLSERAKYILAALLVFGLCIWFSVKQFPGESRPQRTTAEHVDDAQPTQVREREPEPEPEPIEAPESAATLGIPLRKMQPMTRKCEGKRIRDVIQGKPRLMCTRKSNPPFVLEAIGDPDDLVSVTLMQMIGGAPADLLEQLANGVEVFLIVAGEKPGEFMPDGWFATIAEENTRHVYGGRVYTTQPLLDLNMIVFSVAAAD